MVFGGCVPTQNSRLTVAHPACHIKLSSAKLMDPIHEQPTASELSHFRETHEGLGLGLGLRLEIKARILMLLVIVCLTLHCFRSTQDHMVLRMGIPASSATS